MAESLVTLLEKNIEMGNDYSYTFLEDGYFDLFFKSLSGYLQPANGSSSLEEVRNILTFTISKIIIIEDGEDIGFKMLDRSIGHDKLMGFINSNFDGTLEEKNVELNLDNLNILGLISGLDDTSYLTK